MIRRTVVVCASCLFVLALSACHDLPKPRGSTTNTSGGAAMLAKSPIEVAVAPVVDASHDAPGPLLRAAFQRGLVVRRYSPLALDFVDKKVSDASYRPGSSDEQAVLTIQVDRWDTSLWSTHHAVLAALRVQMVDAKGGDVLWTGTIDRRFDLGNPREQLTTDNARLQAICTDIAGEVLERLPKREPRPGHADS